MFDDFAWETLNEIIGEKYHQIVFDAHQVIISNRYTIWNSGLYIATKYPIIRSQFYTLKKVYTNIISRGVLFVELKIGQNKSIIVGNTHLQEPSENKMIGSLNYNTR